MSAAGRWRELWRRERECTDQVASTLRSAAEVDDADCRRRAASSREDAGRPGGPEVDDR